MTSKSDLKLYKIKRYENKEFTKEDLPQHL